MYRPEIAAATAILLAGLLWTMATGSPPGAAEGNDFVVFLEGAHGLASNGNPYGTGFVSPPQFALLMQPLRMFDPAVAAWLWLASSLLAIAACVMVAFALVGLRAHWWLLSGAGIALGAWPAVRYGLELGQNSPHVALLLLLAAASAKRAPEAGGALVAAAAAMKPHLALPLAVGLTVDRVRVARDGRFPLACVGLSLALLVASWAYSRHWAVVLANGPPQSWNYWGSTIAVPVALFWVLDDLSGAWLVWAVGAIALALGLGIWRWRDQPDPVRFVAAIFAATPLVTPYAYPHDYVILVLPLSWCITRLVQSRPAPGAIGACALVALAWLAARPAVYDEGRFTALALPATLLALCLALGESRTDHGGVRPN